MVTVLVRDQHGVKRSRGNAYRRQPLEDFLPAQAGINQQASVVGGDKRRIAGAAAPENANPDDSPSSSPETL